MTTVRRPILVDSFRPLLGMIEACHPGPTAAVTLAAGAYGFVVGRTVSGVILVTVAVLFGQLTTGWQNDAIDAPIDTAVGRSDKPIPGGLIERRTVALGAVVAAIVCVVVSYLSGWKAGTVHVGAVAIATAYNVSLKRTALSIVPYIGAFGLLPCFVTLGAPGAPWPPWSIPVAVALLGACAHVLNVLPDAEFDRRSGVSSLPARLPLPVSWMASGIGLTGSCALLTFADGSPSAEAVGAFVACTTLGFGAVLFGARRSPWGFRLACLVALADVGVLAASRH